MSTLIFYWWICATFFSIVRGDNCVYQNGCTCGGNDTYCIALGLKSIPPLTGTGIVNVLMFDYNSITNVPAGSLPPNIQQLSMMYNPIASIDESAFRDSVNSLESVSFSSANFTTIPNAFAPLESLHIFMLLNTRIIDWNEKVMRSLGARIDTLTLEDCSVQVWPEWLEDFTNLTTLSFANNLISTIPDNGLASAVSTLTVLNLGNNTLTAIPKALSQLTALQILYLNNNRITDVTWLPPFAKITFLLLMNNFIQDSEQLSRALLPYADSLQNIIITQNSLTSIPNLAFLTRINTLDFSLNKIYDAVSGSLPPNLYSTSFNSNNLRAIPKALMTLKLNADIILFYNSLTQILSSEFPVWTVSADVSYNLITELTVDSFPPNSSLQYFIINNNPLHSISNQAFRNVPQLEFLNVQSTKLTRVPLALLSAVGLMNVELSGCPYMICTCQEKALAPWFSRLPSYAVDGDCGRTSIYDFFTILARDCP